MASNPPRAAQGPRALAEILRALDEVIRDPLMNARTLEVTLLDTATTTINHGLGRVYTNYVLNLLSGPVTAGYVTEDPNADKRTTLKLTATGYGADVVARITVW